MVRIHCMFSLYVFTPCIHCMYLLHVCIVCMHCMYSRYVIIVCIPCMYALYVIIITIETIVWMQAANPRSHANFGTSVLNHVLWVSDHSRGLELLKSSIFIDLQFEKYRVGGKTMILLITSVPMSYKSVIYFVMGRIHKYCVHKASSLCRPAFDIKRSEV